MRFPIPYKKIVSLDEAAKCVKEWQSQGLKVVITAGVFDIPTYKHAEYLLTAANFGDKLIVRVDTDNFVLTDKYPEGSIVSWKNRCKHLAHYPYVDLIIPNIKSSDWIEKLHVNTNVYSITSSPNSLNDKDKLMPRFKKSQTDVIFLDEKFDIVPKAKVRIVSNHYEQTKFSQTHFSGSIIKKEIIRRASK
jgi:glycerol-3-phosphate cytidylyltransferase-like family protein